MATEHFSNEGAAAHFVDALNDAVNGERWLAVVLSVENGRLVLKRRTCNNFPDGDLLRAAAMITGDLFKHFEAVQPQPPAPLPVATLEELEPAAAES